MTVAELIAKLQEMPQGARVVRWDSDDQGLLLEIAEPSTIPIRVSEDGLHNEAWLNPELGETAVLLW